MDASQDRHPVQQVFPGTRQAAADAALGQTPGITVNSRKMTTPCRSVPSAGLTGITPLSIHPAGDQNSQAVNVIGSIIASPVRNERKRCMKGPSGARSGGFRQRGLPG
ncbi:MAG TPA: hypothetical protein PLL33_06890 [Paracoccus sp. (in: a-proteobacteria)]|nr:hypothetical protein [Paracoccus sp. (in: a-proteobacteria)]